jgi:hypothetical protein
MPTGDQVSFPTITNDSLGSNGSQVGVHTPSNDPPGWNLAQANSTRFWGCIKRHKVKKIVKDVPWRTIFWVLVNVGVFGGCVAGTVLTHGAGAPLFVLFIATVKWAKKDIKEQKYTPVAE